MIKFSYETKALMNKLAYLRGGKGLKYAIATAMTKTAVAAKAAFDKVLSTKLDRPTPQTQRATRYQAATKDRQEYDVFVKGADWDTGPRGKNVEPNQYLKALTQGGYRANKKSEMLLRAKGVLPAGWQMQPGDDAKLNAYGNIPGGTYVQVLSAMKAFREQGYQMNRVTDGRTGRNPARDKRRAKTQRDYFVLWSIKTKTPLGIYTRKGKRGVAQIFKFVPQRAKYSKVLDFKASIDATFRAVFEGHFQNALWAMLQKVKLW